ncbi:DNA ligase-1 [Halopseudomonas xinjiangensis]|uniref:DNA ligase-1 n=1 Tax=Halopseudomonas xinjiangensis TaxID=487184 RepID=A0A1H1VK05_9GAMM|nr:DNA ligase [Halopseudomonas xinjiangensis]SDS84850.1 DNA ligase-1 [Halopseudomonas xinjiangensis]
MRYLCSFLILSFTFLVQLAQAEQGSPHQPMLASVYRGEVQLTEYWVSEKLDGVRGHWDGDSLWTRGGYRIAAPDWFTDGWPATPMDGELWIARGRFDEVSGIVRSTAPNDKAWRDVRFMVFDLPAHGGSFDARVEAMRKIAGRATAWLQPVEQYKVTGADQLDQALHRVVAAGGEGLMLHHQHAVYRSGRSQDLLKYKQYEDAEAWVVGYTEGSGKYTGKVGALIVERDDGRRFRLGSGLSDAERDNPPPIGSWVTYRFNGLTSTGLPRFARFMRIREEAPDMPQSVANIISTTPGSTP